MLYSRGRLVSLLSVLLWLVDIVLFVFHKNNSVPLYVEKAIRESGTELTEPKTRVLSVSVVSSKDKVQVNMNARVVYQDMDPHHGRGVHMIALDPINGNKIFSDIYDTYISPKEYKRLINDYTQLQGNPIVVFASKDEMTFKLTREGRAFIKKLGSTLIDNLRWRDTWAFVMKKGESHYAEKKNSNDNSMNWARPVEVKVNISVLRETAEPTPSLRCASDSASAHERRSRFCLLYKTYWSLCDCGRSVSIDAIEEPLNNQLLVKVPVLVMAGNRPHHLYRMLQTLLRTPGALRDMITVYIHGYYEEVMEHYRRSFESAFDRNKDAKNIVILEEDLEVSPDIFEYFAATMPLLDLDLSIYCISAWNDQGYEKVCNNPELLYRVEAMPGSGWVLSKRLWEELAPEWEKHSQTLEWDKWIQDPTVIQGRECVIPEISRTYNFGFGKFYFKKPFSEELFTNRVLNKVRGTNFRILNMLKENYEIELEELIRSASLVDHGQTPCSNEDFVPRNTSGQTYVAYIRMQHPTDFETWLGIAKCYKIWDLDVRGFHRSMFRLSPYKNHLVIIGYPASAYSYFKPDHVVPIFIPNVVKRFV